MTYREAIRKRLSEAETNCPNCRESHRIVETLLALVEKAEAALDAVSEPNHSHFMNVYRLKQTATELRAVLDREEI